MKETVPGEQKKPHSGPQFVISKSILNFTPSWFSVTMGTGILSILLHTTPHKFHGEEIVGTVLYIANIVLFVTFTLLSVAQYTFYPGAIKCMLHHPSQSLFLGTIPMGLATIVNATVLIAAPKYGKWAADLSWALWWLDVFLTLLSVFGVPLLMFHVHTLSLDAMTAAWLLPVVPAIVCGASGGLVASVLTIPQAQVTLLVSYLLWGIGMILSLIVMSLYFHRLAVHGLPNSEVIISAFLPLGPCGQGASGIIQIAQVGNVVFSGTSFAGYADSGRVILIVSVVVGLMVWGLGLWWLVHGVACVLLRMRSSRLQFNMGFWGCTFPLGVFVAGTISLGEALPSAFFAYLSIVLLGFLVVLYVAVALLTVVGAYKGSLSVAPCMSELVKLEHM